MLQITKSQVWTQPAKRVCPNSEQLTKRESYQGGMWEMESLAELTGDNSNTHPDPLSPPTVLEKGTGPWASLPTPPSAVELTCPWAPARHLLLLLQIPSSLLKYSSSFPSLCYMSFEILVRTFFCWNYKYWFWKCWYASSDWWNKRRYKLPYENNEFPM